MQKITFSIELKKKLELIIGTNAFYQWTVLVLFLVMKKKNNDTTSFCCRFLNFEQRKTTVREKLIFRFYSQYEKYHNDQSRENNLRHYSSCLFGI